MSVRAECVSTWDRERRPVDSRRNWSLMLRNFQCATCRERIAQLTTRESDRSSRAAVGKRFRAPSHANAMPVWNPLIYFRTACDERENNIATLNCFLRLRRKDTLKTHTVPQKGPLSPHQIHHFHPLPPAHVPVRAPPCMLRGVVVQPLACLLDLRWHGGSGFEQDPASTSLRRDAQGGTPIFFSHALRRRLSIAIIFFALHATRGGSRLLFCAILLGENIFYRTFAIYSTSAEH